MRKRRSGPNFGHQRKKANIPLLKEIFFWFAEILIVILVAYVCVTCFGARTSVVGVAMEDTLENGEQILVNKFTYIISGPKSGDIVVFLPGGNEKSHYYVRRVIAGPGDTVQVVNGAVQVNGSLYEETTDVVSIDDPGLASDPIELGSDQYFVLGDNRNNSEDSRYATIGLVSKDDIVGKAWFHFGGISNMGFL